jgi:hypothetical protein
MIVAPYSFLQQQATLAGVTFSVRNDPYSASLITAQPFSIFPTLGMTSVTQSLDGLIRTGNLANSANLKATGSLASYLYPSASVVSSGSYNFATNSGYQTSISQENSMNCGVVTNAIGSNNFVIEFWFNPRQNFGGASAPFHMWCGGADVSGDRLTIQWSNATPDLFRFYVNGSTAWSTTPNADQGTAIVNGNWNHVAFVKSSTSVYVYLNGTRIGVGTRASSVNAYSILQLGGVNSGTNNDGLRKTIQDYRLYIGTDKGYTGATITVPNSIVQQN